MLHACLKGKTKIPELRYRFNGRVANEKRTTCEDEIVSTVFGMLDFLPAKEVGSTIQPILAGAVKNRGMNIHIPDWLKNDTDRSEVRFWERMGDVEPDILITLWNHQGEVFRVLIEAKWNSPLSEDQLLHQARKMQENLGEGDESWIHVYLSKDIVIDQDQHHDKLVALTWLEFAEFLPDQGNSKYAQLCRSFLQSSGARRFNGFSRFHPMTKNYADQEVIFWKGWGGWSEDLKSLVENRACKIAWSLELGGN